MGNPQHLEWLLEGVEAWNARRERDDFVPNFKATNIREAFKRAKLTEAGMILLNGANLRKSILCEADLEAADLRTADLSGVDLRRADLSTSALGNADLRAADLRWANFRGASLAGANLLGADLREADFVKSIFGGANLMGVDLRGASLGEASFRKTVFGGANVRTVPHFGADANDAGAPEHTDLSNTRNLTQKQLNSMAGDFGTILPVGLERPAHWPDWANRPLVNSPSNVEISPPPATAIKEKLVQNQAALVFTAAALLEQIAAYRFEIHSNNLLAEEKPDFRDKLLHFLDGLSESIAAILNKVPGADAKVTDEDAEEVATWMGRFIDQLKNGEQYLAPEKLADASKPVGIVLSCGAFGSLLGWTFGGPLGGPAGFAAGSMFGQMITNHLKPGVAADKVQELLQDNSEDGQP